MVVAFNRSVKHDDEWFDEPDELDRIERLLAQLDGETDPVIAAAHAVSRIARSQAFTEGNKRTALLVGRWILDRNGIDGLGFIPVDDTDLGACFFPQPVESTRPNRSHGSLNRGDSTTSRAGPNRAKMPGGPHWLAT
jgi:hypothetical protein